MAEAKVVIVTGAASGIGRGTAETLYGYGYSVVLVDLRQDALDKVVAALPASTAGNQAFARATDVSSTKDLQTLFAATKEKFGSLYGVAHCAGILGQVRPVHEQDEDDLERIVQVNFLGTVRIVREAVKVFRAQGSPPKTGYSIVTVGSFMIVKPVPGCAVYSATKGAVKSFNQAVARENADAGIRINTVNPGGIRTGMTEMLVNGDELPAEVCPMRRWGQPNELAEVIEFLLSPRASFVTGSTYDVDGGKNA